MRIQVTRLSRVQLLKLIDSSCLLVKWPQKIHILKSKSLRLPFLEDEFSACSVVVDLFDHMMGQLILMKNNPKIENVIANNKVMNGF